MPQGRFQQRPYIDERPCISTTHLRKQGVLSAPMGSRFTLQCGRHYQATITYQGNCLLVEHQAGGREIRSHVFLKQAAQPFGGSRYFLICPKCGRSAVKLRLGFPHFVCQKCLGLHYTTQGVDDRDRLLHLYRKAAKTIDPDSSGTLIEDIPLRRKWAKLDKYLERREKAEELYDQALEQVLAQFNKSMKRVKKKYGWP